MGADRPIEMGVDEVEPRRGSPMPEQPRLDVFRPQWFAKQGIVEQIDLADRQVIRRAPVAVEQIQVAGCRMTVFCARGLHGLPLGMTGATELSVD